MIGAIIGDIVGSQFKTNEYKSKKFEFWTKEYSITVNTIMVLAVAKAIMLTEEKREAPMSDYNEKDIANLKAMTIQSMQEMGRKYPLCEDIQWSINKKQASLHNGDCNGAAIWASAVGFTARSREEVCLLAKTITGITHDNLETLKAAEASAMAVFMAQQGCTKGEIRQMITDEYYPLDFTIEELREYDQCDNSCQDLVPQGIKVFLESIDFEDAIRTAVSIDGDRAILAAFVGSIAAAFYGVPKAFEEKARTYLDEGLLRIYNEWCAFNQQKKAKLF